MSRLEYCAEAEPLLLTLWEGDALRAYARLRELVGPQRYATDWSAAQKPVPPLRDPGLFSMECYEAAYPHGHLAHRIHDGFTCRRHTAKRGTCQCIVCSLADEIGIHEAVIESEKPVKAAVSRW